jgi:hypothetical protein
MDVTVSILEDETYQFKKFNINKNVNITPIFIQRHNLPKHDLYYENAYTHDSRYIELAQSIVNM